MRLKTTYLMRTNVSLQQRSWGSKMPTEQSMYTRALAQADRMDAHGMGSATLSCFLTPPESVVSTAMQVASVGIFPLKVGHISFVIGC